MRAVALLLACLVCIGYGRRVHTRSNRIQGRSSGDHEIPGESDDALLSYQLLVHLNWSNSRGHARVIDSFKALAGLLVLSHPAAGWQLVGHAGSSAANKARVSFSGRGLASKPASVSRWSSLARIGCKERGIEAAESPVANIEAARRQKHSLATLGLAAAFTTLIIYAGGAVAAGNVLPATTALDFRAIFQESLNKAIGGGKAGFIAAIIQVLSLCWLNTALTYQYRYGGDLRSTLKKLLKEGGIPRLYQGATFALIEVPVLKFGVTASNAGVRAFLGTIPATDTLPPFMKKAIVSLVAGLWRILCNPVSTLKVTLQAKGLEGLQQLMQNVRKQGVGPLYKGSAANYLTTALGLFPWLMTFDYLNGRVPPVSTDQLFLFLLRNAFLGFGASCTSAVVTNFLRVIKTTQQAESLSIAEAVKLVLEKDGMKGLFGRGLKTMFLLKAIQESVFTACWRYLEASWGVQYK